MNFPSIFRKGGNFAKNLFKKQAQAVGSIFRKAGQGLDFLGGDKVRRVLDSPVADALASRFGAGGILGTARNVVRNLGTAKKFTDAGAEVGNIYSDIADKGVNKNTLERVSRLSKTLM